MFRDTDTKTPPKTGRKQSEKAREIHNKPKHIAGVFKSYLIVSILMSLKKTHYMIILFRINLGRNFR